MSPPASPGADEAHLRIFVAGEPSSAPRPPRPFFALRGRSIRVRRIRSRFVHGANRDELAAITVKERGADSPPAAAGVTRSDKVYEIIFSLSAGLLVSLVGENRSWTGHTAGAVILYGTMATSLAAVTLSARSPAAAGLLGKSAVVAVVLGSGVVVAPGLPLKWRWPVVAFSLVPVAPIVFDAYGRLPGRLRGLCRRLSVEAAGAPAWWRRLRGRGSDEPESGKAVDVFEV